MKGMKNAYRLHPYRQTFEEVVGNKLAGEGTVADSIVAEEVSSRRPII